MGICFLLYCLRKGLQSYANGNKTKLVTEINDNSFIATGDVKSSTKYTVLIKYTGHETMITGTYIRNNDVEYISGKLPEISGTPKSAVLKALVKKQIIVAFGQQVMG